MSYPKHPGDPEAHRELAARHLVLAKELAELRAYKARTETALVNLCDFYGGAAHNGLGNGRKAAAWVCVRLKNQGLWREPMKEQNA